MKPAKSLNFYATPEDIRQILVTVEASLPLQYVRCGLFDDANQPLFEGVSSLPALGCAQTGQSHLEPTFLVMFRGSKLNLRIVPQRKGGVKYAVDQLANPGTITIRPGGIYKDSILIAGMLGTTREDPKAEQLMTAFSSALKRCFTKLKSYLVGRQAKEFLSSGMRLTHSANAPRELDLSN